jgi:ABC-2 type transport system permease protein
MGKMVPSGVGDALFGYVLFMFFVRPDLTHMALFVLFTLSAAMTFLGFMAMAGSLSFFVGNAEVIAEQWIFSLITFSTYPSPLFDGAVKVVLFTLIPAGIIAYLPVETLHTLSPIYALANIFGACVFLFLGASAFYLGLRRYESGNLVNMQG